LEIVKSCGVRRKYMSAIVSHINGNDSYLGIELGSTRIKATLIDGDGHVLASGGHGWENNYVDGNWTYDLEDVWKGIQSAYRDLMAVVVETYGDRLASFGAIGISGMMHGYLVFDKEDQLLVPFRTWRNNLQGEAAQQLTNLLSYPIPQRWSVAHLYQSVLNEEDHVKDIAFQTTLAGYVHWRLTGEKVLGIGEASGMFPIDLKTKSFNKSMINQVDQLLKNKDFPWQLAHVLPKVLVAGSEAGRLTAQGAKLLDPTGTLKAGLPLCPPEGDAGTGMVATNSIAKRTGNVSAGTSIFGMVVLENDLKAVHPEIDQVTTPEGNLVAMAHANNCTSDLNAWVGLLGEAAQAMGARFDTNTLYQTLYSKSLEGDKDAGGVLAYGYLSGEHITGFEEGRPLLVRGPQASFNLANFMRANLFSALGALKIGFDLLLHEEGVELESLLGHGGFFKTEGVGQRYLSAAIGVPVSVMATAGEGGPWGMAILAAYSRRSQEESLKDYLEKVIFKTHKMTTIEATPEEVAGCQGFMDSYRAGLAIEQAALDHYKTF